MPAITQVSFSGVGRAVQHGEEIHLEIYHAKHEALAAGVPEEIAHASFSDIRVAWCYVDVAEVQGKKIIVACKKRSLGQETCQGECHLFGDGADLDIPTVKEHIFEAGVSYVCKCIEG